MGKCIFCQQDAGFLRRKHKECANKNKEGIAKIQQLVKSAIDSSVPISSIVKQVDELAPIAFIEASQKRQAIIQGFSSAVNYALEDDLLSNEEEKKIEEIRKIFDIKQEEANSACIKLVQSSVIRDIGEGNISQRINVIGVLPFMLQKSEVLVWVFNNIDYYEIRKKTVFKGGSTGINVRVAKGVYLRQSAFRGYPEHHYENEMVDCGKLGITNKHIYFSGDIKKFRVPYKKLISFEPLKNGFEICKDTTTAKPQSFILNEDTWFGCNLIAALASQAE